MNRQRGMTMVELMVSLAIVMLIIGAATTAYLKILRSYKTQGRLAESYMANLTGLEMLRYDIETAGFGLPADLNGVTYNEAVAVSPEANFNALSNPNPNPPYDPSLLNDSPSSAPRAFAHLDNQGAGIGTNQSDVLSIKSSSANINPTSKKWSMITFASGTPNPIVKEWGTAALLDQFMDFTSLPTPDKFIVLDNNGKLINTAGHWLNTFNASAPGNGYYRDATLISPAISSTSVFYMYGLDNSTQGHRMPFNRVDYYLDRIPVDFPSSCDKNTFTLYRSVVDQNSGQLLTQAPLIDCVADFQVAFGLDPNGGTVSNPSLPPMGDAVSPIQWQKNLAGMNAAAIQATLREVRIFILYQEGLGDTSKDPSFRFAGILNLGDQAIANSLDSANYPAGGNQFQQLSLAALPGAPGSLLSSFTPQGTDQQYRWKIIEMAVKPMNLINLTNR
jgi:Tfp pilus assembly protein PilW